MAPLYIPFPACFSLTAGCCQDSPSPDPQKTVDLLISLLDDRRDTLVRMNTEEGLGKISDLKSKPILGGDKPLEQDPKFGDLV